MLGRLLVLLTVCLLVFAGASAEAGKRVALVVGNGAYEHTVPLANPANDARDVAAALRSLGFEVFEGLDLDQTAFSRKVRDFARAARGAEAALFYYAGHGLQMEGSNYLVPVDARLTDEADLRFEAMELTDVVELMERASPASLVFLDACRDNPLAQGLARSLGATRTTSVGRGLARVESSVGTLIAYATQPGNVAVDGSGRNSPFTAAFLENIKTPGLEVNQLLNRVRQSVLAATDRQQTPWTHSSLTQDFYLSPPDEPAPAAAEQEQPAASTASVAGASTAPQTPSGFDERQLELEFWQSVKDSEDWADFQAYLNRYGAEGTFGELAQRRRDFLKEREAQLAAAKAREEEKEKAASEAASSSASASDQTAALPEDSAQSSAKAVEQSLGLSRSDRRHVQRALNDMGHKAGVADGLFGKRTRAAITSWQLATGAQGTGYLTVQQANTLVSKGKKVQPATSQTTVNSRKASEHHDRARDYIKENRYDLALSELNQSIRLSPTSSSAYATRGTVYKFKGMCDRALQDYDKSITLNPKNSTSYLGRGLCYCELRNSTMARIDFVQYLAFQSPKFLSSFATMLKKAKFYHGSSESPDKALLKQAMEMYVKSRCR